ncbi:Protein of unknown function [Oceanospirillum multiglobuliferum]|uniref:ATP-binding protein n=1 Tax=Oceanospirillum multiglobuliferum TaxID=64969 RepID=A0A1T4SIZ9_9GAMM|nr:ATP-binding protein [Oceanospirillum multiglobuliferum]OPX54115.1 ATP-binding protein [Oceanospirillum multiglobuliferum]SKA27888.1 Protein of unknown function [Oceanospirillum multiglobuliferum]
MSQLLRIVLIHTHLPGVVEIQMDEHTNICGTNASGKTTLQRLIPVFYGEQPNRVVPKTRKKFDEFYLPFSNSYIVYEYRRGNGDICQAVLTRKSEGGLEYRFIGAPYQSECYLQHTDEGVKAYSYHDWAGIMRHQAAGQVSAKLSATSEYRSIIQNDVATLRGSGTDSAKLRRLAAAFSLVDAGHKLRHIEKLVSAVHAKEGKMDTLKAMLAAIFEEDGVTLPTTKVKNTKAREWIQQMRHSSKLESLQKDFDHLKHLALQLDGVESQLAALFPLLSADEQQQKQHKAESEERLNELQAQLRHLKESFEEHQSELISAQSKTEHDLKETTARLDQLQYRYDDYESRDMAKLQRDTEALPLWRDNLIELQAQYQLMSEQHSDLEHQLDLHKIKLSASLDRLSEQRDAKVKQLQQQKNQVRETQDQQLTQLEQAFQKRIQAQQSLFADQLTEYSRTIAILETQLSTSSLTEAEYEEARTAELRLEQAQAQAQQHSRQMQLLQQTLQQARQTRDQANDALERSRKAAQDAEKSLQLLHRQLAPEQGSLRHFLRLHYSGWEQTLGKVLDERLLERQDLHPNLSTLTDSLYGLRLELAGVETPDYAQDEEAIRLQIQSAERHVEQTSEEKAQAEKQLKAQQEQVELTQAQLEQAEWQRTELEQNIDYARDARDRLKAQQQSLNSQRQEKTRTELHQKQAQLEALKAQQQQDLHAMTKDHGDQRLELKADWQTTLQGFDQQIDALEAQLASKREENKAQLKELQQAFDEELSAKGIDPRRLSDLKQRQEQLKAEIKRVENRQDELNHWHNFMTLDWQKMRPELLAQETQLKQDKRQVAQALNQLKTDFTANRKVLDEQRQQQQGQMERAEKQLSQIKPALAKLNELNLTRVTPAALPDSADLVERLSRTDEALEQRSKLDAELNSRVDKFDTRLKDNASPEFLDRLEHEKSKQPEYAGKRELLPVLADLLHILQDQRQQLIEMGENIGGDLKKFFTVFSDINRRIAAQSRRLSEAVADDLVLEGIRKSEVRILSTIDELGFWQPLKHFAKLYDDWSHSVDKTQPSEHYLNALADVVELLRADEQYSIESLLRLELHLSEGGSELVIRNDRQLLESSSHGMAYLILCKYLLAFTRLLRGESDVTLHWPIDEIGTLAYHNVEKLFQACSSNRIVIVGAFPNPESDVLMLFQHRYLIEASQQDPTKRQLKRIQPKISRLAERLAAKQTESNQQEEAS